MEDPVDSSNLQENSKEFHDISELYRYVEADSINSKTTLEFESTVDLLKATVGLELTIEEYQKMMDAITQSKDRILKSNQTYMETQEKTSHLTTQNQSATKSNSGDQHAIKTLKQQIKKLEDGLEASNRKEVASKVDEKIDELGKNSRCQTRNFKFIKYS